MRVTGYAGSLSLLILTIYLFQNHSIWGWLSATGATVLFFLTWGADTKGDSKCQKK